jgi:CheY-like chemotaxis protein
MRSLDPMSLQAMLVCRDPDVVQLLPRLLTDFRIQCQVMESTVEAVRKINREKFDGIFADFDVEGAGDVLRTVRRSPANRKSVSFAIIGKATSVKTAFDTGANFVVYKPLSREKARSSLRAAHGLMMRERRRYFRHNTDARVSVSGEGLEEASARLIDLSIGGMAIRVFERIAIRGKLQFTFPLPETQVQLHAEGEVTWSTAGGHHGIQFTYLPDDARYFLEKWLAAHADLAEANDRLAPVAVPETKRRSSPEPAPSAAPVEPVEPELAATPVVHSWADISEEADAAIGARTRSALRGTVEATLTAVVLRNGKPTILQGECHDLTEEGVGTEFAADLLVGERVLLEMALPDRAVTAHAEIRFRKGQSYGFRFITLTDDQRDFIKEYWQTLPLAE